MVVIAVYAVYEYDSRVMSGGWGWGVRSYCGFEMFKGFLKTTCSAYLPFLTLEASDMAHNIKTSVLIISWNWAQTYHVTQGNELVCNYSKNSCLNSCHCGLILALRVELVHASWSHFNSNNKKVQAEIYFLNLPLNPCMRGKSHHLVWQSSWL